MANGYVWKDAYKQMKSSVNLLLSVLPLSFIDIMNFHILLCSFAVYIRILYFKNYEGKIYIFTSYENFSSIKIFIIGDNSYIFVFTTNMTYFTKK